MADVAISGLTALGGAPATNDLLVEVDVSDTTQAPTGTTKKMTVANLFTAPTMATVTISSGGLVITTGGLVVSASGATIAGGLTVSSGTAAVQGMTVAAGLTVSGGGFVVSSGGAAITGTLGASGDFAIATNKFTVAASTGNTVVAGTLGVTSDFAIATNKFTVAAATGNTVVAGTLGVTGAITGGGSITTGPPIGGTTAQWKVGIQHFATVTLLTSQYIELDVNGTLYKLATVS